MSYRVLRSVKNRYGATNEICVFQMTENGLIEIENPSAMLLNGRVRGVSGSCVGSMIEGTRSILTEVQALVTKTGFGTPRRMAMGFDYNRLCLIIAVLEKHAKFLFSSMDVYVNVVGGLRLEEPAADLPVAIALISAIKNIVISENTIAFGEIGLSGEIRAVNGYNERISEANRLGFQKCISPIQNYSKSSFNMIEIKLVKSIYDVVSILL